MEKVTAGRLRRAKLERRGIAMLTAYDALFSRLLDEAGVDVILVGDSLGNVVLGYRDTRAVTMADMVHHTQAAARGVKRALLVADLPYRSVGVKNAKALLQAGARAVKIEGLKGVRQVVRSGVPVMGHLGFLPQSMRRPKVQRSARLIEQARALEKDGVFAIVLELVEPKLAGEITAAVQVPTIGIGSGPHCDGQVLVGHDLLGLSQWRPSFARPRADLRRVATGAVKAFIKECARSSTG